MQPLANLDWATAVKSTSLDWARFSNLDGSARSFAITIVDTSFPPVEPSLRIVIERAWVGDNPQVNYLWRFLQPCLHRNLMGPAVVGGPSYVVRLHAGPLIDHEDLGLTDGVPMGYAALGQPAPGDRSEIHVVGLDELFKP